MPVSLLPEISVVETSQAVSYELPPWRTGQLPPALQAGLLGATFSICGIMFTIPVVMTWASGRCFESDVARCCVAIVWPSLIVGLGLLIYAGRGAPMRQLIELTSEGIGAVWQVGRFRRSRRIAWEQVDRLALGPAGNEPAFAGKQGTFLLQLVPVHGKPVWLGGDDDRDRLRAVAEMLSGAAKGRRAALAEAHMAAWPPPLAVVEECPRDVIVDREVQPRESTAILEHSGDGLTITIPPFGLRRIVEDRGVASILVIIAGMSAWFAAYAPQAVARDGLFGLFSFKGSMLTVPPALVLTLILAGVLSRRAELSVRNGVLTVRSSILVFTRRRTWRHDELADVRAVSTLGSSDTGPEWRQNLELQLGGCRASTPVHLLSWREKAELEWIATTLRRSLRASAMQIKFKKSGKGLRRRIRLNDVHSPFSSHWTQPNGAAAYRRVANAAARIRRNREAE